VPKTILKFSNYNITLKLNGIFENKDKYQTKQSTWLFCSAGKSAQILGTIAGYLDSNYPVSGAIGIEI